MDEVRITSFNRLGSAVRDELTDCFDGDADLAGDVWAEVVFLVESARRYGFSLQTTRKKSSNRREGGELARHMKDVGKQARALRVLLDADTLGHLAYPPGSGFSMVEVDQRRNVERVRTIKRLLLELEAEVKDSDWTDVPRFRLTRLDYFLANAIPNMLRADERCQPFQDRYRRLLGLVLRDLGTNASVDEAIKGAARHK